MRVYSFPTAVALATLAPHAIALLASNSTLIETRSLNEIHEAALQEGGVVTLWHGGSDPSQQDRLKSAFEGRFPGMTLNVTVRSSSLLGPDIDQQLASGDLVVDSAMLQTTHDYPRWKAQGVLLNYKPAGFDKIYEPFKDEIDGAWASSTVNAWSIVYNKDKLADTEAPATFLDFLKPEFKDKIAVAYPNEDDAVLHTWSLIFATHGVEFFEAFLKQNPKWVPRADLPIVEISQPNTTYAVTFGTTIGLRSQGPLTVHFPSEGAPFTSWAQRAAIFNNAPHPEAAKLLHSYVVSEEYQRQTGSWSTRRDVADPEGFTGILSTNNTDPTQFVEWMSDRAEVERQRFWFQGRLGYPA